MHKAEPGGPYARPVDISKRALAACKTLASRKNRHKFTAEPTLGPWSGCSWTQSTGGGGERELGSADSPGACIAMVRIRCPGWDVARFPEAGSGP